ncbi:MAG: type III pantothenate kinase [Acidobacteria bacterium]|nr:type III pantothenate kinase [Acidobacteriota bacterium]
MLLAIDIGNSNTTLGVFRNHTLVFNFRLTTRIGQTMDEYGIFVRNLLSLAGIERETLEGMVVASVVPPLDDVIETMAKKYLNLSPLFIRPGVKTGLALNVESPSDVGADRIVDCVGALSRHKPPFIVVDFGTATTFDAVSEKHEFLGGAIAPGLKISAESLFQKAAKLPEVPFQKPDMAIGRNTVTNIQSGLFFGYVGLVNEILSRMKRELGSESKVIATGGLASVIVPESGLIDFLDENLTLEGLRVLFEKNHERH